MKWTAEAEDAIKKIPFFVRKRVRSRVEKEAEGEGKPLITIAEVKATQARFLSRMETDIKGYQIETCFGAGGCPNRANAGDGLMQKLEALLAEENLLEFLKKEVKGPLKYHHEFRITLADCPNACSQPQIKDIGIIGACVPEITQNPCSQCEACVDACREQAISLETGLPVIQFETLSVLRPMHPGLPHGDPWGRHPGISRAARRKAGQTPQAGPRASRRFQRRSRFIHRKGLPFVLSPSQQGRRAFCRNLHRKGF